MRRDEWSELATWWEAEVHGDLAYREEVLPLVIDLLEPDQGARYLDLGCGEGQISRALLAEGAAVVGCDLSQELLQTASRSAPVVRARLPELGWLREGSFHGAVTVLVLEHLAEVSDLFEAVADVVRSRGVLVAVLNHPVFTAPGSGPIVDPEDGEVLWRWGRYLEEGATGEPAGDQQITFHHRPLGHVLGAAAQAGWCLDRLEERGVGEAAAGRDALLAAQRQVPRLLGVRWRRT